MLPRVRRWLGPLLLGAVALSIACEAEDVVRHLKGAPVPDSHTDYVGEWQGEGVTLRIEADGMVRYERKRGSGSTSIEAPIQRFEGDDFVVGLGPLTTTFRVSERPHREGDAWRMTVDGVELRRMGRLPSTVDPEEGVAI